MNHNKRNDRSINQIFSSDRYFQELHGKHIITSMSEPWNKISSDMRSHRYTMLIHLAKLYYWRDYPDDINNWKDTCRKGFEKVPLCKHNNKYPEFEKVYSELWTPMEDVFDETHDQLIKDVNYNKKHNNTTEHELPDITIKDPKFKDFCKDYVVELCNKVSKGGISSEDNSELIDSLLLKYPLEQNREV